MNTNTTVCSNCANAKHGKEGDPLNRCTGANGCYFDPVKKTYSNYAAIQRGLVDFKAPAGPVLFCLQWKTTRTLDYCLTQCTADDCLNLDTVNRLQQEQKKGALT